MDDADSIGAALPYRALDGLLDELGLSIHDGGGGVTIVGSDPVASSRHPLLAAASASLALQGVGLARLWQMRGGSGQDISVDGRRAVYPGLQTIACVTVHDHRPQPQMGFSPQGYFGTKDDRHVCLVATHLRERELDGLLDLLGCQNNAGSVSAAVGRWQALELEEALAAARLPGAVARTTNEWLRHPQGQWLAARPVIEVMKISDGPATPFPEPAYRPLSGIRVLDATHVLAGPMTSRLFAEHGADVLHIWSPGQPYRLLYVLDTDVGKRSAFVDLDTAKGLERFRSLAREADVIVQSWRPGSFGRRGLSAEDIAREHAGVVYVSISCYGSDGPWAERGGYDFQAQSATGIGLTEGEGGAPAETPTYTLADYLAPYHAAAGVFVALMRRATEGGSYHVRVSLSRSLMWLQELPCLPSRPKLSLPEIEPSDILTLETAFGRHRIARPLVDYSETPAYFQRGCDPVGSSEPVWLDA